MCTSTTNSLDTPSSQSVGDAVGVAEPQVLPHPQTPTDHHWYIALVGTNQEKTVRQHLEAQGYEAFVASQREIHVWRNGKRQIVEAIKISNLVFIRCTESERRQVVTLPYIKSFLVNRSGTPNTLGQKPIATIPDVQMQTLRYMLYQAESPVRISAEPVTLGDHVRIIRGKLSGFEGRVIRIKDATAHYVGIQIDFLGCAMIQIPPSDIEKVA